MHEGLRLTLLLLAATSVFVLQSDTAALQSINQQKPCFADTGDNVTLTCFITNNASPVTWLKRPNQTVAVGSRVLIDDQRFVVSTSANSSVLHLANVSGSDAGPLECLQPPHPPHAVYQLVVRFSPIIFAVEPDEVVTSEGDDIQLFCNATGHPLPNVTWRRANRPLDDIVFTGRRLNISSVKKSDGGIYSCEAENGFGQRARRDVLVHVEFAPEVSTPNPEVFQAVNYTAKLLCFIQAFPVPQIMWLKDEEEISVNDTQYVIAMTVSSNTDLVTETHLMLSVVRRADYGNYSCRASNRLGESSVVFALLESAFPVLTLVKENETSDDDRHNYPSSFNVTGFILGMMPPLWISFYIILHLGFRSRYAEERPEEEGGDGLDEIAWEQGLHFTTKF